MRHEEYRRIIPNADTAVLFIHGIVGTPDHFSDFIPLVPPHWSIYNVLLDGHGGTVKQFASSSMAKWRNQVQVLFEELSMRYRHIVLVGHSMGTLFSIQLATAHPEKVPFLFLLAVPMKVGIKPVMFENSLRVAFGRIREDDSLQAATRDACSVRADAKFWRYIPWLPRFLELFQEIRDTRKLLPGLRIPCYAYQSGKDELVSGKTVRILENCGNVRVTILENSYHFYYHPKDKAPLLEEFKRLCEEL